MGDGWSSYSVHWWNTLTNKEEALTFITGLCIPNPCHRSICIDKRSIGIILIQPGSEESHYKTDITYAEGAKHWGQGIGTTAVKMAISSALNESPYLEGSRLLLMRRIKPLRGWFWRKLGSLRRDCWGNDRFVKVDSGICLLIVFTNISNNAVNDESSAILNYDRIIWWKPFIWFEFDFV